MKPLTLFTLVLALILTLPVHAFDEEAVEEEYSETDYSETGWNEDSAGYDQEATDATTSYDDNDVSNEDANWEAEAKAYCEELASYEDPAFRDTFLQDCLLSQLGQ